jgi:predicted DNA-binding ribbon-helix-helix protein
MPHYFFDVVSRNRFEYDSDGTLLSDMDEARKWAQLLALTLRAGNEKQEFVDGRIDVRGPDGFELFSIPIRHLERDLDQGPARWSELREDHMKSRVVKRSIMIAGGWSSVSLEEAFWKGLKGIAADRGLTLSALVETINSARDDSTLSSVIRLFVLDYYRTKIGAISGAPGSDLQTTQRHKQRPVPHTPLISVNSQYCQERAIQARTVANHTREPEARQAILALAEQYENLANRTELLKARAPKEGTDRFRLLEGSLGERPDPSDR